MFKKFQFLWIASALAVILAGCDDSSSQSVFDETEMAKYRSNPDSLKAASEAAKNRSAPSKAEVRKMAAEARAKAQARSSGS